MSNIKTTKKVLYIFISTIIVLSIIKIGVDYRNNIKTNIFNVLKIDEHFSCFQFMMHVNPKNQLNLGIPLLSKNLVINNQEDYQKLNVYKSAGCTQSLPTVDFIKSTVLGNYSSGDCSSYDFKRSYIRDDASKTIIYSVNPKNHFYITACSGPGKRSMNLVEVPKIPSDYKIQFVSPHNQ